MPCIHRTEALRYREESHAGNQAVQDLLPGVTQNNIDIKSHNTALQVTRFICTSGACRPSHNQPVATRQGGPPRHQGTTQWSSFSAVDGAPPQAAAAPRPRTSHPRGHPQRTRVPACRSTSALSTSRLHIIQPHKSDMSFRHAGHDHPACRGPNRNTEPFRAHTQQIWRIPRKHRCMLARHKRCSLAAHLLGHAGARQQAPIGRELDAAHDVSIVLPRAAHFPLRPLERANFHERSWRRL